MGKQSEIEWTDATWNPWYGCRKVSPGCKLCYAERDMGSYGRDFSLVTRAAPATFNAPLKWKEPLRIFTCSWSDFFIEEADPWRVEAWQIILQTPQHTYLILTKRIERVYPVGKGSLCPIWPNVGLGVSAENQEQADKRIPLLLQIPAALRWVSYEPVLGPIKLLAYLRPVAEQFQKPWLQWLVIGGESARPRERARPFHLEWAFDALAQCRAAGVPCFIKQLGSNPYYHGKPLRLRHWKGAHMSEWPEGLRVREFPRRNSEL